ncbi:hypothetical protein J6590_049040 [Homalodisca vitripennis]|nr:hypothetical protein J6590_049040 [Homalodisca vitripennis]
MSWKQVMLTEYNESLGVHQPNVCNSASSLPAAPAVVLLLPTQPTLPLNSLTPTCAISLSASSDEDDDEAIEFYDAESEQKSGPLSTVTLSKEKKCEKTTKLKVQAMEGLNEEASPSSSDVEEVGGDKSNSQQPQSTAHRTISFLGIGQFVKWFITRALHLNWRLVTKPLGCKSFNQCNCKIEP